MNVVALVGNLATDPELRVTSGNRPVCTFRVAVSRPNGTDADFFTVVAWERQAEVCKQYLAVGRRVAIDGRLHHSTWEVEEGEGKPKSRRSKVEIIAHRVEMLGKPRRDEPEVDFAAETTDAQKVEAEAVFA
jgi:single-strand DNA-binding protein